MPIIDLTDVVGIHEKDGSISCVNCLTEADPEWPRKIDAGDFIMREETEDAEKLYICDRCKEEF